MARKKKVAKVSRARPFRDLASGILSDRQARVLRNILLNDVSSDQLAADIGISRHALNAAIAQLPIRRKTVVKLEAFFW